MKKADLIQTLSEKTNFSKKDTTTFLNAFCDIVKDALKSDDEVNITGFGKFYAIERSARTVRNPKTGKKMKISARKSPAFKAGKLLKEEVA